MKSPHTKHHAQSTSWRRHPAIELLGSMRFAVSLLSILGIASMIGTVIVQNRPYADYVVQYGNFWAKIFRTLGFFDVYSSTWFVIIMLFLVISTTFCLWRNTPLFLRDIKSFREGVTAKSLRLMTLNHYFEHALPPDLARRYLKAQGFQIKESQRHDGSVLIAAKQGSLNKLGYIFAHVALIVICLGGLIDSNLFIRLGILTGRIVPDQTAVFVSEFNDKARLGENNLSFRGNVNLAEGQSSEAVFLDAGNDGFLVQFLPYVIKLNRFQVDYYANGMPRNFSSFVTITDKASGQSQEATIEVNHPLIYKGTAIYQSNFGDGGSMLTFKVWNQSNPRSQAATMQMRSMQGKEFPWSSDTYRIHINELKSMNVEAIDDRLTGSNTQKDLFSTFRQVDADKNMHNVGASISYSLTDPSGQVFEFMNYMQPRQMNNRPFYFYGFKRKDEVQMHWLALPLDSNDSADTFMLLRRAFATPKWIEKAAQREAASIKNPKTQADFKQLTINLLSLFNKNNFNSLEHFIQQNMPGDDQERMQVLLSRVLFSATHQLLKVALEETGIHDVEEVVEWREAFVQDSLQALTQLKQYPAPVLMQLMDYDLVQASGLQITRSPGEKWVYLGAFLLTLGSLFMLYLQERRAWIFYPATGGMHFALSSKRHKQETKRRFLRYVEQLSQLNTEHHHE